MNNFLQEIELIITTRNRFDELLKTINSSISIGIPANQIFVIDDASFSFDKDYLIKKLPGLNVFKNDKPKGQHFNRNFLFTKTKANYVLSLDDDAHLMSIEDLEEAYEILKTNDDCGILAFNAFEQIDAPPPKETLPDKLYEVRTFIACGCLIKKEVFNKISYYTKEVYGFYCEEVDFSIRAYMAGFKTLKKESLVVHHRVNRNFSQMPVRSKPKEGIYGSRIRAIWGFSDNLIAVVLYYPFGLDILFILRYSYLRFRKYVLIEKDFLGFIGGLLRFIKYIPYTIVNCKKMSFKKFKTWINLQAI